MSGMRRPYRSASSPKINAPTGRKAKVTPRVTAISASDLWNSRPMAVRHITNRKKSKASRVQPRKPASTAARWSPAPGAAPDSVREFIYWTTTLGFLGRRLLLGFLLPPGKAVLVLLEQFAHLLRLRLWLRFRRGSGGYGGLGGCDGGGAVLLAFFLGC